MKSARNRGRACEKRRGSLGENNASACTCAYMCSTCARARVGSGDRQRPVTDLAEGEGEICRTMKAREDPEEKKKEKRVRSFWRFSCSPTRNDDGQRGRERERERERESVCVCMRMNRRGPRCRWTSGSATGERAVKPAAREREREVAGAADVVERERYHESLTRQSVPTAAQHTSTFSRLSLPFFTADGPSPRRAPRRSSFLLGAACAPLSISLSLSLSLSLSSSPSSSHRPSSLALALSRCLACTHAQTRPLFLSLSPRTVIRLLLLSSTSFLPLALSLFDTRFFTYNRT